MKTWSGQRFDLPSSFAAQETPQNALRSSLPPLPVKGSIYGGGKESRDIKNRGIDRGRYDMEERLIRTHGVDCTYEGTRTTIVDGEG